MRGIALRGTPRVYRVSKAVEHTLPRIIQVVISRAKGDARKSRMRLSQTRLLRLARHHEDRTDEGHRAPEAYFDDFCSRMS